MTNYEFIKSLSEDTLADWLSIKVSWDCAPWTEWFDKKYCQKCDSINTYVPALERETECAYCEINDKCRYFPEVDGTLSDKEIIKLWLASEVAKNENT